MDPRTQRTAWAGVTAAGVLAAFAPVVVGLKTLSQRDTDRLYAPVRTLVVDALRDGRLPLWNPFEGTGKPLFAEGIHSVLHPISLVGAALAPASVDFLILGYLVAAALGAFALARTLDASPEASAGAGLAYALSGYAASMTGNLVFLAGLATLPWQVAGARRAGEGHRWGAVATALVTACAFFSGDVQVALTGLALGTLAAAEAGGVRGAGRAWTGMLAGTMLAGVQIAASRAALTLSTRGTALTELEKAQWSLEPARVLEWILPGLFRGPLALIPRHGNEDVEALVFAESVFVGAPLLVAAALAARAGGRRIARWLLLAGAALVWLALGRHLGARQLLDGVPVWGQFRFSEKLMAPFVLVLSAAAALGIDAFRGARLPIAWRRALVAIGALAAAAFAWLLAGSDAPRAVAVALLGPEGGPFFQATARAALPHLLVAVAALLAADRLRGEGRRGGALALAVALAPAAALSAGAHLGDPALRRAQTPMRLEAEPPGPRLVHPAESILFTDVKDRVETSVRQGTALLDAPYNVRVRVDAWDSYGAFGSARYRRLIDGFEADWVRGVRRFGVTHVVVPVPLTDEFAEVTSLGVRGGRLVQRDDAARLALFEVPHRPWAAFAGRAVASADPEAARETLRGLMQRDEDATVVVEAPEPPATAPGRVLAVARGTEALRVDAESEGPALLVVQDAYWPGWQARIDGAPVEILAADALVRAVRWPAGRHRLEMTYDPPEIRLGLALSAVGALFVGLLAAAAAGLIRRAK